jgi:hypothetical protein
MAGVERIGKNIYQKTLQLEKTFVDCIKIYNYG